MIEIRCTTDGFRRGGIAHPAKPTCYPEDHFTDEQLAQIEAEPKLAVTKGLAPTSDGVMSVEELQDAIEETGLTLGGHENRHCLIGILRTLPAKEDDTTKPETDTPEGDTDEPKTDTQEGDTDEPEADAPEGDTDDPETVIPEGDTTEAETDTAETEAEEVEDSTDDALQQLTAAAKQAIGNGDTITSGAPEIKAMEAILGRNVTAAERDQAWAAIQAEA